MSKATTIKEALKRWEDRTGQVAAEATDIQLQFQWLPIEKMDNTLSTLTKCEKLSLSTNMIEKIVGINNMKNLKILSLARNYLRSLSGLEALGETLKELWVSYNQIEKLKGIESMKSLKVLYIGNNMIKDWTEFNKFNLLPALQELLFNGNPLSESMDEGVYRNEAVRRLANIKKLDGEAIVRGL